MKKGQIKVGNESESVFQAWYNTVLYESLLNKYILCHIVNHCNTV